MQKINQKYITSVVKKALLEDISPKGDITTNLIDTKNKIIKAKIIAKQNGIISGLSFCKTAFKLIGKETVFRSKIELRGEPFVWWIKDLSAPDILFYLPFKIPLYGDFVCALPVFMAVSMFIQQRMMTATTGGMQEQQQKLMQYFMMVFFFLLFRVLMRSNHRSHRRVGCLTTLKVLMSMATRPGETWL